MKRLLIGLLVLGAGGALAAQGLKRPAPTPAASTNSPSLSGTNLTAAAAATSAAVAAAAAAALEPQNLPPLPEGTVEDVQSVGELTVITSDKLTYDQQKSFALFERNVVVSDPNLKMKTDKLTLQFADKSTVTNVIAEGRVVLSQLDKRGWSSRATYSPTNGIFVLEGDARVMQGRNMILADRITFWRNENRMEGYPNARCIFYPEKGSSVDLFGPPSTNTPRRVKPDKGTNSLLSATAPTNTIPRSK